MGNVRNLDLSDLFLDIYHFYTKALLRTVHGNIKLYNCESCNKSFGQKAHLINHVKRVHQQPKKDTLNQKIKNEMPIEIDEKKVLK